LIYSVAPVHIKKELYNYLAGKCLNEQVFFNRNFPQQEKMLEKIVPREDGKQKCRDFPGTPVQTYITTFKTSCYRQIASTLSPIT